MKQAPQHKMTKMQARRLRYLSASALLILSLFAYPLHFGLHNHDSHVAREDLSCHAHSADIIQQHAPHETHACLVCSVGAFSTNGVPVQGAALFSPHNVTRPTGAHHPCQAQIAWTPSSPRAPPRG